MKAKIDVLATEGMKEHKDCDPKAIEVKENEEKMVELFLFTRKTCPH